MEDTPKMGPSPVVALAIYILALMSLGSIFAFGLWGADFAQKYGWTAGELAFVYSCGALGNYSCLFPGWVCDQRGPRAAVRLGLLLLALGWAGIFAGLHLRVSPTWIAMAYFLEEQGNAFVYMGITMDALSRFPSRLTGTVNGVTSAAYGMGAVVWTSAHAFCTRTTLTGQLESDISSFLQAVCVSTLIFAFVAERLAQPAQPKGQSDSTVIVTKAHDLLAIIAFACFAMAPVCSLLGYLGTCATDLGIESLTLFANTAFVLCTCGRVVVGLTFDALGKRANAVGAMALCAIGFAIAFYKLARLALIHTPHGGGQIEAMGTLYTLLFLYGGLGPVLTCGVYQRFGAQSAGTVIGAISVAISAANALLSAHVQLVPGHLARPLMISSVTCLLSLGPCVLLASLSAKAAKNEKGSPGEASRLLEPLPALQRRVFQVV